MHRRTVRWRTRRGARMLGVLRVLWMIGMVGFAAHGSLRVKVIDQQTPDKGHGGCCVVTYAYSIDVYSHYA